MRKYPAVILFAALALAFSLSSAQAQGIKVGVLDMARIFGEYHKTKEAEKNLSSRKEGARKEVADQEAKLKELLEKIDGLQKSINDPELSVEVKSARKKQADKTIQEARALRAELLEFTRRRELQLLEMFNRQRDILLKEIREEVTAHATESGYDLVLDKSARGKQGILFLLYSKDARDFSSEMIAKLNAAAK
ncbi:MAG: OmpH family outer membrane protein [Verrucomicrobiales bacterium]|nr:OmpH family outer membrane protein [Verrucomicrobiales bacterium]